MHSRAVSCHSVPIERLIAMIKCVGLASINKTIWSSLKRFNLVTQLQKPFILHMVELSSNAGVTIKYNLTVVEQTNHSISNLAQEP